MSLFSAPGITNILLGLVLFTIFVSIFYFTFVAMIEGQIVKAQINILVDSFTGDFKNFNLGSIFSGDFVQAPDMTEEDEKVETANKNLLKKAAIVVGVFAGITLLVCGLLWYKYRFPVKDIIISNIVLLLFIAVTELFYIYFISKSFQSLDPNVIKLNLLHYFLK